MGHDSWMTAEIGGPKKASIITKPEVADVMITRAKRPILIVGNVAAEIDLGSKKLIDYLVELARKGHLPVVATAHTGATLRERGFVPDAVMPAVDIGNRLADPAWKGLDGKGQYDLAIISGLPYQMGWTILSALKHFAPHLRTMCLDNVYQPNASWSFPNIPIKEWDKNLRSIIENLER